MGNSNGKSRMRARSIVFGTRSLMPKHLHNLIKFGMKGGLKDDCLDLSCKQVGLFIVFIEID